MHNRKIAKSNVPSYLCRSLLTSRVILHPRRATALLTRNPTAPKQATQADLRYPPPHLRLLNQHRTESPLEACETVTSIQQVQPAPLAPALD